MQHTDMTLFTWTTANVQPGVRMRVQEHVTRTFVLAICSLGLLVALNCVIRSFAHPGHPGPRWH